MRDPQARQTEQEGADWLQITVGVALVVGIALATPWLRMLASYTWGP